MQISTEGCLYLRQVINVDDLAAQLIPKANYVLLHAFQPPRARLVTWRNRITFLEA